jgi:hypothetical protein
MSLASAVKRVGHDGVTMTIACDRDHNPKAYRTRAYHEAASMSAMVELTVPSVPLIAKPAPAPVKRAA